VLDAIRRSRQMMKGKKGRFFLLGRSFIGCILLSVLSFFIGLLWVIPYFAQSQTCFYLELTGRGEEQAEGSRWNNPQF
ncbi:MAG: DUF975 family protein, partial [Clostridiales bacterium]|nr:DUF975 family protein [Clostridiales bacterium]